MESSFLGEMADILSQRLGEARIKEGLSQQEVAKAVGVSVRTYQRWETGRNYPFWENVERLADVLHVDPRELVGIALVGDEEEVGGHDRQIYDLSRKIEQIESRLEGRLAELEAKLDKTASTRRHLTTAPKSSRA